MNYYRKQITLSIILGALMVVGLWYGRPRSVGSACGGVDWNQVDVYNITLSQDGQEEAVSLSPSDPLYSQLTALLQETYCTRQFSDQIPIDRGEKNVVTFSGGADLTLRFQWEGEDYALLLTNEALFVRQGELQRSYMPLRRAEPRQEILALFQEV